MGQRVRILDCYIPEERGLVGQEAVICGDRGDGYWVLSVHWLTRPAVNVICHKDDAPTYLAPILHARHEQCDADFKRDLDRMLEKEEVR